MRTFYTYILASNARVLYVGVTNDLVRRMFEHRTSTNGFTARYRVRKLVHYEIFATPSAAIAREKQLKVWLRTRKIELIESANPDWRDLASGWFE